MIGDYPWAILIARSSTLCFGIAGIADAVTRDGHWISLLAGCVAIGLFVLTLERS